MAEEISEQQKKFLALKAAKNLNDYFHCSRCGYDFHFDEFRKTGMQPLKAPPVGQSVKRWVFYYCLNCEKEYAKEHKKKQKGRRKTPNQVKVSKKSFISFKEQLKAHPEWDQNARNTSANDWNNRQRGSLMMEEYYDCRSLCNKLKRRLKFYNDKESLKIRLFSLRTEIDYLEKQEQTLLANP